MTKEEKFYSALRDVFVGSKVQGKSGQVNLMRIKAQYYETGIFPHLSDKIERQLKSRPKFREELFDKLYSFFSRYFSESGSIFFRHTPLQQGIYERVYTDDKDVFLFWKTHMLFYVKTDRTYQSVEVPVEKTRFFFDVSDLQHKKANELRDLAYSFSGLRKDGAIGLKVTSRLRGAGPNQSETIGKINKVMRVAIDDSTLSRAIRIFERQSEVDYFINKDAKAFLDEQFDLWLHQYLFKGKNKWDSERIEELQILREVARDVISFIAQFESELLRIWKKPKFTLNSNYVLTLDRIPVPALSVLKKIIAHGNFKSQIAEWRTLGIVSPSFRPQTIWKRGKEGRELAKEFHHLPIDTVHFKSFETELLSHFGNLDSALDGWLVKSENYQALQTLLPRFRNRVQSIYIDPPFNTGDDFEYMDKFQNSTWLSLLRDRISIGLQFLTVNGNFILHLDENANHLGKLLLQGLPGGGRVHNEIIWDKGFRGTESSGIFQHAHDTAFLLKRSDSSIWNQPTQLYKDPSLGRYNQTDKKTGEKYALIKRRRTDGSIYYGKTYPKQEGKSANDVISYVPTMASTNPQRWAEFRTQKPEELLQVFIEATSNVGGIVLDFFAGSGTTLATAHKSKRKWIGVEMGDYFDRVLLARMKEVLAGRGEHEPCGISEDVGWTGGGFFKYCELEQYDTVLGRAKYEDSGLFDDGRENPYSQYVFMRDLKLLEAVQITPKAKSAAVDLSKLYPNIDVPQTLSNHLGKGILRVAKDFVEFEDKSRISIDNLDWATIKPLIWW